MEELFTSAKTQEVADLDAPAPAGDWSAAPTFPSAPAAPSVPAPAGEASEQGAEPPEGTPSAAPADPPRPRDFERDSAFAAMRRAKEAAEARAAAALRDAERATGILKRFDFAGESPEDVADAAEAKLTGRPVEEVRNRRAEAGEIEALRRENAGLRQAQFDRVFQEDIRAIKKKHPDLPARTVDDLGPQFAGLRAAGVEPLVAYEAIRAVSERARLPMPPSMGSVKSEGQVARDYFTKEEIAGMSQSAIEANIDKVNQSLKRKGG